MDNTGGIFQVQSLFWLWRLTACPSSCLNVMCIHIKLLSERFDTDELNIWKYAETWKQPNDFHLDQLL